MKPSLWILTIAAVLSPLSAFAQQSAKSPKTAGILQIGEIRIVGRVQKPIASVDVMHVQPKLTLAELRQPFLDRIEEATSHEPF